MVFYYRLLDYCTTHVGLPVQSAGTPYLYETQFSAVIRDIKYHTRTLARGHTHTHTWLVSPDSKPTFQRGNDANYIKKLSRVGKRSKRRQLSYYWFSSQHQQ